MLPSLHRLLWGPTPGEDLAEWTPRPWEVPAVGLPVRVAAFLYSAASRSRCPLDWTPETGPLTWSVGGELGVLVAGRLSQFEMAPVASPSGSVSTRQVPVVKRTADWEVPPHEAFFLPLAAAREVAAEDYSLYCDVLLLITALDGGEAILSGLAERGVGTVPFVDRWAWRSRIHLPEAAWAMIDSILHWSDRPERGHAVGPGELAHALESCSPKEITEDDFERERVDIALDCGLSAEIPRTVRQPGLVDGNLPGELELNETKLADSLLIRIGQTLDPEQLLESRLCSFPRVVPKAGNAVLEQVASAFEAPHHASPGQTPDLVVFPEPAVPQPEARTVRDLVRETGIASLSGLYWRQLKPAYPARGLTRASRSWFVNEAELALPVGHKEPGPTGVRWYRVRKPVPAHIEAGLASALGTRRPGQDEQKPGEETCWAMLKGRRWYRFLHPGWGDFTVAICADLLDAAPWRSLRGEIMHLFMVAFNRDLDLFDALTRTRSYENFANVVTVNDGRYGGSVLWTPKRGHRREAGRVRGGGLFVTADVRLPVKELFHQQRYGVAEAERLAEAEWQGKEQDPGKFKAPPPGFRRRASNQCPEFKEVLTDGGDPHSAT